VTMIWEERLLSISLCGSGNDKHKAFYIGSAFIAETQLYW